MYRRMHYTRQLTHAGSPRRRDEINKPSRMPARRIVRCTMPQRLRQSKDAEWPRHGLRQSQASKMCWRNLRLSLKRRSVPPQLPNGHLPLTAWTQDLKLRACLQLRRAARRWRLSAACGIELLTSSWLITSSASTGATIPSPGWVDIGGRIRHRSWEPPINMFAKFVDDDQRVDWRDDTVCVDIKSFNGTLPIRFGRLRCGSNEHLLQHIVVF